MRHSANIIRATLLGPLLLSATASYAQDTDIAVGGAVRFQYSWEDYDDGNRGRGGDLDLDTVRINFDGEVSGLTLSAELRYYQYMEVIHHAWLGYDFNEQWQGKLGISQVPFGNLPYNSHSFFFSSNYYVGLEDDYDFGLQFLYDNGRINSQVALFKNDEQGGIDGYVDNRSDRYSYDIVGNRPAGEGNFDEPGEQLAENNTVVWRFAGDLNPDGDARSELGFSILHGQLNNDQEQDSGDYQAYAVHMDNQYGPWNLQLTTGHYKYNVENGSERIAVGAYSFFDSIASEADIHSINLAYTWNKPIDGLDSLTFYSDNSLINEKSGGLPDTQMHVFGVALSKGKLYTYFDFIIAKNQPFIGGSIAGDDDMTQRLNINFGFYF